MKSIKEKAEEYAKTKHTNKNLIDIVSWDFEAGASYVIECIENLNNFYSWPVQDLYNLIKQLKSNQ